MVNNCKQYLGKVFTRMKKIENITLKEIIDVANQVKINTIYYLEK